MYPLFDAFVGSILNTATEVWGFTKSKPIERLHLKFCKRILNVRSNSSSTAVYGDLGRYPLYVTRYVRIIKYWCKLVKSDNNLLRKSYEVALADYNRGKINWVFNCKKLLDEYGLSYVFNNSDGIDVKLFPKLFKRRVTDCFKQDWNASIGRSPILEEYRHFKSGINYESYLDILPYDLRFYFTRIRISAHSLRIQTGRFGNNYVPRNERFCNCCNTRDIEDVYHFILICPLYDELRKTHIDSAIYRRPSVYKLNLVMETSKPKTLLNVAQFIKKAVNIRNNYLNTRNQ